MNELREDNFAERLKSLAGDLDYPRTPDIAGAVMTRLTRSSPPRFTPRRWAWALTIILILFSGLMFVPPARAAILEFIQIGVVRIFHSAPTTEIPTEEFPVTMIPMTATPAPTFTSLIPMLEQIAGETSLEDAAARTGFDIPLPAYPADLGKPDYVFVQDANGWMVVLVWLDPVQPDKVLMSLHLIASGSWAVEKVEPRVIEETTVNGLPAVWAEGEYPLFLRSNKIEFTRLIEGRVLIWEEDEITYRLETDLSLDEARRVAESLQVP